MVHAKYYVVESTGAKVTAKQAKVLIEKFCTDLIEKTQVVLDARQKNLSMMGQQDLSRSESASNTTFTTEQIQAQIDERMERSASEQSAFAHGLNPSTTS